MDIFRSSPRQPPAQYLLAPPPRHISTAAADRLSAIMENPGDNTATPTRAQHSHHPSAGSVWSTRSRANTLPRFSEEQGPPEYAKFNYTTNPPVGARAGSEKAGIVGNTRRGGWGRLLAIIGVVFLVVIALAVGLGVGLTRHHNSSSASSGEISSGSGKTEAAAFPVGEYSLITSLSSQSTNCSSNAATWLCYPYQSYDATSPNASMATFNWILSNTSDVYATNSSKVTTDSSGIPANISISSTDNPFSISISNISLTYINNDTNPRYYFEFAQPKSTIPTAALTSSGSASECFFNQTQLIGTLYLTNTSSAPSKDYPNGSSSASSGGYTSWPYAINVQQVSPGGTNVPACYETKNGVIGSRITDEFTSQGSDSQCVCNYQNYDL